MLVILQVWKTSRLPRLTTCWVKRRERKRLAPNKAPKDRKRRAIVEPESGTAAAGTPATLPEIILPQLEKLRFLLQLLAHLFRFCAFNICRFTVGSNCRDQFSIGKIVFISGGILIVVLFASSVRFQKDEDRFAIVIVKLLCPL